MDLTVHERTVDRATNKAEISRIHAQGTYIRRDANGAPQMFTNHDGRWCSPQGTPVENPERDIPPDVLEEFRTNPIRVNVTGPEVIKVCEFCKEEMNSSQYDEHLKVHIRNLMLGDKAETQVAKPVETPEEPPIGDPPVDAKPKRTMSAEQKAKLAEGRARAKAAREAARS